MALQFKSSQVIDRPIDKVFHFFAVEHVRNHPRWDSDIELWLNSDFSHRRWDDHPQAQQTQWYSSRRDDGGYGI